MPDRPELAIDNKLNANIDTFGGKLQREAELLRDGLGTGILKRADEMWDNPGDTALNLGACAVLGAGLNLASRAGGRWAAAARITGYGLTASLGIDVMRRGVPTLGAMADTWSNPGNLDANKDTVAKYAGSALVDYPLMMAAGYGGFRAAGKIPMGTAQFHYQELSPNFLKNEPMSPATEALIKSGVPINAATRGLMENPAISGLKPGDRGAALKALTDAAPVNPATAKLVEGGIPINSATRGLMENPAISGLKPGDRAAAIKQVLGEGGNFPGGGGAGGTKGGGKFEMPNFELPKFNPADFTNKFNLGSLTSTIFSVRAAYVPTIIPFDLIKRSEHQLVAGKLMGAAAGDAAAGGIMRGIHDFPKLEQQKLEQQKQGKLEQAPMPRVVEEIKLDLPKIELQLEQFRPKAVLMEQMHERIQIHKPGAVITKEMIEELKRKEK